MWWHHLCRSAQVSGARARQCRQHDANDAKTQSCTQATDIVQDLLRCIGRWRWYIAERRRHIRKLNERQGPNTTDELTNECECARNEAGYDSRTRAITLCGSLFLLGGKKAGDGPRKQCNKGATHTQDTRDAGVQYQANNTDKQSKLYLRFHNHPPKSRYDPNSAEGPVFPIPLAASISPTHRKTAIGRRAPTR